MWPVDEVDDGAEPPVPDFIATEARIGAHYYELLGVILSRGEGVWAWDAHRKRYVACRTDKPRYSRAPTTSTNAPAVSPASALTRRREHFGPFALARVLEGITTSFGNNWQAIDIARGLFDHFFQMRLEIVI
jgi:hypothetical protein